MKKRKAFLLYLMSINYDFQKGRSAKHQFVAPALASNSVAVYTLIMVWVVIGASRKKNTVVVLRLYSIEFSKIA